MNPHSFFSEMKEEIEANNKIFEEVDNYLKKIDIFGEKQVDDEVELDLDLDNFILDDLDLDDLIENEMNTMNLTHYFDKNINENEKKETKLTVKPDNEFFDINFFKSFIFDYPNYNSNYVKSSLRSAVILDTKKQLKPYIEYLNKELQFCLNNKYMLYPISESAKYKFQNIFNRSFIIISYDLNFDTQMIKYYEILQTKHIKMLNSEIQQIFDEYFLNYYTNTAGIREIKYILSLREI